MKNRFAFHQTFAVWVLIVGLFGTATSAYFATTALQEQDQTRFAKLSDEVAHELYNSVNLITYGLGGANGIFAASKSVEHNEFASYVHSRTLPKEFPGVWGFGFISFVKRADLNRFISETRQDNQPHFSVKTTGNSPNLFIIKFLMPEDLNGPAIGFDIASEPIRQLAAETAMTTGLPTLTKK